MKSIIKWLILGVMVQALCLSPQSYGQESNNKDKKPNVVFFLVDDMGWVDVAVNGSKTYETPNIDKLAQQGMSFSGAYAAHPLCIASRFAIMTGKFTPRIKDSKSKRYGTMSPQEITMADAFKSQGYKTFFAGKWHLGKEGGGYPQDQGFDVNVGGNHYGAPADYFYPYGQADKPKKVLGLDHIDKPGDYLTDSLTKQANRFISANQDKPFFLYLSHYGVHVPFQAKEAEIKRAQRRINDQNFDGPGYVNLGPAKQKMHQDNAIYAAMVKSIDDSLGSIVSTLERHGLTDDTIIVFTSDNGGESTKTTKYGGKATSNLPLKAGKCWLYEGGIRVPLIVKWPGKIKGNSVSEHPVTGPDFYPTLMELSGLTSFPSQHLDGRSFAPELVAEKQVKRDPMFWHFGAGGHLTKVCGTPPGTAVNDGQFKLINWYESGEFELYDLSTDIGEKRNLAGQGIPAEKRLLNQITQWQDEMGISTKD